MTIFATHGVVKHYDSNLFAHRNLIDEHEFVSHLRSRKTQYVALAEALRGGGDALTIDDSIRSAGRAAELARRHGHAVTLFVNGYNIQMQRPYCFSRLAVILDHVTTPSITYRGTVFSFARRRDLLRFRRLVKQSLATEQREDERHRLVSKVRDLLALSEPRLPEHLTVMTSKEVHELVSIGVDVQNHGWSHTRVDALTSKQLNEEIYAGRLWIEQTLGNAAPFFAVPNGDGLPPADSGVHYDTWLLLDESKPIGPTAPRVINRLSLSVSR